MSKEPLHDVLCDILGVPQEVINAGDEPCYFNPPSNNQLKYPCIIYSCSNSTSYYADNINYIKSRRYKITIIDSDPDSKIPDKLEERFPYCTSDRFFSFDGLSHFVYNLFYSGPRIKEEEKE